MSYTLAEINEIIERDEFLEAENADLKHEINELKAQLNAKEEGAVTHWQTESRDGWVWRRPVTVIEGVWVQTRRAVA